MFGMQGWQLVIVVAVIVLLFGSRKLPDMARGLGQSLKIFKSETKGLVGGDDDDSADGTAKASGTDASTTGSSTTGSSTTGSATTGQTANDDQTKRDA